MKRKDFEQAEIGDAIHIDEYRYFVIEKSYLGLVLSNQNNGNIGEFWFDTLVKLDAKLIKKSELN
jgi:hypothetical protein